MAIVTGTLAAGTAIRYAAPHIVRFGARRLTLALAKRAAAQAIKKGATKVAGNQLVRGAKLKGIQSTRALTRSLAKSGKEREVGRILSKTNLPKRPPGKNLLEVSKNVKGKVQGQNPFKLEPIKRGRLLGKEGAKYKDLNWLGKQKYDLASGRLNRGALGRNALRLGASEYLIHEGFKTGGNVITGGETGKKIKALKAQRQQAVEAQALIESLDKKEKLQAEQFLATKQKEKALDGLPAENTIEDVREAVKIQVEQRVIPEAGIPTIEDDGGRQEWLDRTANSPAANAGFSDDERWALQQKHRAWKKGRKKRK